MCLLSRTWHDEQHLWPDWMGRDNALPTYRINDLSTSNSQVLMGVDTVFPTNSPPISIIRPQLINRQGHIGTRKLRMVCKECNNTWMSQIEDESKQVLTGLMLEQTVSLSPDEQIKLSSWIALMTILWEFTYIPTAAIPYQERAYFKLNKVPPSNWAIWIGKYHGTDWVQHYRHHGYGYAAQNGSNVTRSKALFQTSAFVVGKLFIYVLSAHSPLFTNQLSMFSHPSLVRIWPQIDNAINWPSLTPITHAEAQSISDFAQTAVDTHGLITDLNNI
jgi:hypothetical protein